jgi:hypothetical protein
MPLKPSQALLRVKSMLPTTVEDYDIDSDESPYICDNIQELYRKGKIDVETKDLLHNHIKTLLDDRFSLSSWLTGNGYITPEQLAEDLKNNNGEMLQYTRQNWLNDMHFYFKSKGM